jgi:flagellar biosynthesis protein FliR
MSNNVLLIFLLFGRLTGFFLLSPLFSGGAIPKFIRLSLAFACSLLIAPPLLASHSVISSPPLFLLTTGVIKELMFGYLIGLTFSLLFEAAAFAGETVGVLMGLSATELLNPLSSSRHPLMASFFLWIAFALFFALDFHHLILRLLYESFGSVPIEQSLLGQSTISGVIQASNALFHFAVEFALFPLIILLSLVVLFALLSRFFAVFWVGFPLQLLVGLITLSLSTYFFIPIFKHTFFQLWKIVTNSIVNY